MNEPRPWGKRPARRRDGPRVFRVAEVNRAAKQHLEGKFRDFWVEGEISQIKRSRMGHVYFTLSDEREVAQLSIMLFASDAARLRFEPTDGARVRVRGNLTIYERQGRFQMIAKTVLAAGAGDLAAQFERIRKKLAAEGLLAEERKRPLPRLPRTVGVVTSAQSAALRDVVRVAHARCPVRLVVADCQVQGEGAPRSIVAALKAVQKLPELDVIVLGRGGGAQEDLWAFNHEAVCRAVAEARVPVVCGVGHETDVTLAELVADARASTPSNAAERAVPEADVLRAELDGWLRRLQSALSAEVGGRRLRLQRLLQRLGDPRRLFATQRQALGEHEVEIARLTRRRLEAERRGLAELEARLKARDPRVALRRDRQHLAALEQRLRRAGHARVATEQRRLATLEEHLRGLGRPAVARARAQLGELAGRLNALSPLRVLERGYAIAFGPDGAALREAAAVKPGDAIALRLHAGRVEAEVKATHEEDE
ncbi:MAG TPA: exodeoxyribonuclease VII large subunit [Polyangiaceae bacterium LLY-WYZ-15_(1-7)]|nr:exodeoxyribonuclease VII large subunit [Polyangiaceae bacterium LLY-WYZ-15_(1-7)]HJL12346.1 exodeoxyribonuclease VII large subunit [Polyangiaceae bacterium LLY-WYZ-15_(1-7)]